MIKEKIFRIWDKENKKMITDVDLFPLIATNKGILKSNPSFNEVLYSIIPLDINYILMQYIDIDDKNGIMIFEGDVVKDKANHISLIKYGTYAPGDFLDYCQHRFMWKGNARDVFKLHGFYALSTSGEEMLIPVKNCLKIIGNIYENPKLIFENTEWN